MGRLFLLALILYFLPSLQVFLAINVSSREKFVVKQVILTQSRADQVYLPKKPSYGRNRLFTFVYSLLLCVLFCLSHTGAFLFSQTSSSGAKSICCAICIILTLCAIWEPVAKVPWLLAPNIYLCLSLSHLSLFLSLRFFSLLTSLMRFVRRHESRGPACIEHLHGERRQKPHKAVPDSGRG
jgi:hypothetical protein